MSSQKASKPNIVFIMADDLGWADLSVYGQRDFETPHLDRLANQGVRFTQAYANSAVCSATRFGLMTGRYQYRLRGGLEEPLASVANRHGLPPEHPTLPSLLREQGYATALIGKWHLGKPPQYGPLKSGYDYFLGNYSGAVDYFDYHSSAGKEPDLWENEVPVHRVGYYTYLIGDEACKYVDNAKADQPFFLSLHFTAPHWPWVGPDDEDIAKGVEKLTHYDGGNLRVYAKMVKALDETVGKVLAKLDERGMTDNTIIIFTSDNGGERFSKVWPFVGQKTELLEGGLRVPTLMRWPARLKPQVSEQVTITMDWVPTLLNAAGGQGHPDYPFDGDDILPVLEGQKSVYPRTLYWRYTANKQRAVRDDNWKYLRIHDNEFLFDLSYDERERANLKAKHPEVFERLKRQWVEWADSMLPITDDVYSHGVDASLQADHYAPEPQQRPR